MKSQSEESTGSASAAAPLNTLSNGLRAVEALADGPTTLKTLSAELDLPRQTAYRIVRTLVSLGWAQRNAVDDTYVLTTRLWGIGVRSHAASDVRETYAGTVRSLSIATGETVHLAVYDVGWSVYIAKHDGTHPISSYTKLGGRSPAYAVATGKVLLAFQPAAEIDRVCAEGLTGFTDSTLTSGDELRDVLARIREDGYGANLGEYRAEVGGVAVPIRSPLGDIIASIGFSGPRARITAKLPELIDALQGAVPEEWHTERPTR